MGETLDDLGFGNDFLDTTPKAQFMKELTSWASVLQKTQLRQREDKPQTGRKNCKTRIR